LFVKSSVFVKFGIRTMIDNDCSRVLRDKVLTQGMYLQIKLLLGVIGFISGNMLVSCMLI